MKCSLLGTLVVLAAMCGKISAQGVPQGHCHCNYSDPSLGSPGRTIEGCTSSSTCAVQQEIDGGPAFFSCVILYQPRYSSADSIVDTYYSCVNTNFDLGDFCEPNGRLNLGPQFENYTIKAIGNPSSLSICCRTELCNTPSVLQRVLDQIQPQTAEPTTVSTLADLDVQVEPPLYALIAIPSLGVCVIAALVMVIVCGVVLHRRSQPRKASNSIVPTVTSRDSSLCGEQSFNDQDYSGSGSGKPLLTQQSIARQIPLHELIGKGRYGEVWKGTYKCDEVAVKKFITSEEASWAHEVDIYKTDLFRHPNILRYIASDNKAVDCKIELWLITEFCEFGSLYDLLIQRSVDPATMLHLAYTACCGLDHLHTEIIGQESKPAIVHRDLKSRNILVKADFTCCIGDLGLALRYDHAVEQFENPPTKRVGTKRYLAPEIIDESISYKHFESLKRADMYSFGLVLWEIVTRGEVDGMAEEYQLPYKNLVPMDPSFEDMKKTVVVEKRRPTIPNRWTQHELFRGMSKLIQQCWLHDSEARLTSLRLKKSLINLRKSGISEKKKENNEQSA